MTRELPTSVRMRGFEPGDLEHIERFRQESAGISFPGKPYNLERFKKNFLRLLKRYPDSVRMLEKDGKVVGYIWFRVKPTLTGEVGQITHVFVEEPFRRRGLATILGKEAEAYFRSMGMKRIRVTVTLTNKLSIKLFSELGYKQKRVVMEKDL
jgi:ribosomal protein S18 acetylase RimI-like enzyme